MDASTVAVTSLRKTFPAALEILADVALNPSFPQAEIERQRASRLASLVQQHDNPQQIAQRVLVSALYGSKHPYGYIEIGTEASNKAMTREALEGFWKQNFVANNAALVVVGDIDEAEVKSLVDEVARRLAEGHAGAPGARLARDDAREADRRGQAGVAADAGLGRHDWRLAQDARLRRRPGHEHRSGWTVLQSPQHEPPRGQRLFVRRVFRIRDA